MNGRFIAEFPSRNGYKGYRIGIRYEGKSRFNNCRFKERLGFEALGFIDYFLEMRNPDDYIKEKIGLANTGLAKIASEREFSSLSELWDMAHLLGSLKLLKK